MLKCHEITAMASDWLDGQLTFGERLRVQTHLWMCRHCRHFVDGLATTRDLASHHIAGEAGYSMDFEQRLQQRLSERLASESDEPGAAPSTAQADSSACNDAVFLPLEGEEDARVQAVFAEIREREGYVPNLFRSYAHNPEQLEQVWGRVRTLMFGGQLSARLKNAIALMVSHDNGCDYCVVHHRRFLRHLGVSTSEVKQFLATAEATFLTHCEQALLRLTREANRNPHHVPPELLEEARQAGASDSDIIEAMSTMELYSGINRMLDTLHIPLEPGIAAES
ncbi:peroxidase-related enzyme [Vreelandella utahensis]|uniref:peroxidase-related enzyme n=1 Tax=Vreelandella halophila TaxID=86177 RepID=UPI000984C3D9|nr:peroxidase-related enzyme [Halomonas utahensis]